MARQEGDKLGVVEQTTRRDERGGVVNLDAEEDQVRGAESVMVESVGQLVSDFDLIAGLLK